MNTLTNTIFRIKSRDSRTNGPAWANTGEVSTNNTSPIATPAWGNRHNPKYFLTSAGAFVIFAAQ